MVSMRGKVILVGAGPGDPELITLKGIKYIKKADVIVYDRLIPTKLLEFARRDCKLIYVGKNPYEGNTISQDFINRILEEEALKGQLVVRLKSGDPYIYGRGAEECLYLIERGIECEVVPGVSSVNAVSAYAGIPLTYKDWSDGIFITSAIRAGGKLFEFSKVPENCTLIVLMISKHLGEIIENLTKVRDCNEPAAIIEKGTTYYQRVIEGNLGELRNVSISSPSLLISGKVVLLRKKLWKLS
jgi:uroporphyrin-III C-methyltransferase